MFGFKKKSEPDTIKAHWQQRYERDKEDFEQILADDVILRNWDGRGMVERSAERRFLDALVILSGSDDLDLARRFAQRSLEIVERILKQDLLPRAEGSFPRNRGCLMRTRVYASSLLGQPWDNDLLHSASRDYEDHTRNHYPDKEDWDAQVQYYYINAIQMALLGAEVDRAESLLNDPPFPLKAHGEQVDLLSVLIRLARSELSEAEREEFGRSFDAFFDRVRDPRWTKPKDYYMEPIGPLDLSLIREIYIAHPGDEVSWERAIAAYSE